MRKIGILLAFIVLPLNLKAAALETVDGDTVRIDGRLAKLAGIDAPEPCQPGWREAKNALKNILVGKLSYESLGPDRHGNERVKLFTEGREVNQWMVQHGLAWNTIESKPNRYEFAQTVAQTENVGIWSSQRPLPPWEWASQPSGQRLGVCG